MTSISSDSHKPSGALVQGKAARTDAAFRQIVAAEIAARQKKTEKLRVRRLAQPASDMHKVSKSARAKRG